MLLFLPNVICDPRCHLLYFKAVEILLDGPEEPNRCVVLDRQGAIRSEVLMEDQVPWQGLPPETCRFGEKDIVAFIQNKRYRLGIVIAMPPSPEEVRGKEIQLCEDVYYIGLVNPKFLYDHAQVHEALLWAPGHSIPEDFRKAMEER